MSVPNEAFLLISTNVTKKPEVCRATTSIDETNANVRIGTMVYTVGSYDTQIEVFCVDLVLGKREKLTASDAPKQNLPKS